MSVPQNGMLAQAPAKTSEPARPTTVLQYLKSNKNKEVNEEGTTNNQSNTGDAKKQSIGQITS